MKAIFVQPDGAYKLIDIGEHRYPPLSWRMPILKPIKKMLAEERVMLLMVIWRFSGWWREGETKTPMYEQVKKEKPPPPDMGGGG